MSRSVRDLFGFVAALAGQAVLFGVFYFSSPVLGSVPLGHVGSWLSVTDSVSVFLAVVRLLGLVGSGWLFVSSAAYGLAGVSGSIRLKQGLGWATVPGVRRLLDGALGLAMMSATVTSTASAAGAIPTAAAVRPLGQLADDVGAGQVAHVPHPGTVQHDPPPPPRALPDPDAASPGNGFGGLIPGTKVYVVRAGDCLSVIAQDHLGDWRLDADIAQLNWGRPQPDGRALADDHWIYPGWVLVMPDDATGVEVVPGLQASEAPAPQVPVPTSPKSEAPAVPTAGPTEAVPARGGRSIPAEAGGEHHERIPVAPLSGVAGVVAAGLIWRLDRRRREAMHDRRSGAAIRRPKPEVVAAETRARAIASEEASEWIRWGLAYLGRELAFRSEGGSPPSVVLVRAGEVGLELMVSPPAEGAPERFHAIDEGTVWVLDADVSLASLELAAQDWWAYAPALVSVGRSPGGPVLANLEHAGSLAISGAPERAEAVLAQMAIELESAPWADEALDSLVVLGKPDHPRSPVDPGAAVKGLCRRAVVCQAKADAILAASRCANGEGRPAVVICFPDTPAELVAALVEAAVPDRSGLVVMAVGTDPGARWNLEIQAGGAAVLRGLAGESGFRMDLEVDAEVATASSLAEALADAVAVEAPEDAGPEEVIDLRSEAPAVEAPGVVIRLFGRPTVTGPGSGYDDSDSRHRVAMAVLTYLATHRSPVPSDAIANALWPLGDDPDGARPKTLSNIVSYARKALGASAEGESRLSWEDNRGYRLAPEVSSDLGMFNALVARAEAEPAAAIRLLREALELVEGEPFESVRSSRFYEWVVAERLDLAMTGVVVDAAEELARLALEVEDYDTVSWALEKGLRLEPAREELHQLNMHALGQRGRTVEVDAAYRRLCETLRAHLDELIEPSQESIQVWRRYTKSRSYPSR